MEYLLYFKFFVYMLMKILKYLAKILKYLLWLVLVWILLFLLVGYAKFDGGLRDYGMYLNQKDWNDAISQVKIFKISSYGNLFWTTNNGELLSGEWHILEWSETGSDDVVSDQKTSNSQLEEDFKNFFDGTQEKKDTVNTGGSSFGFKTWDALEQKEVEWDTIWEGWLSDNKKDLLKLFGR